jgi:hypothetical protein
VRLGAGHLSQPGIVESPTGIVGLSRLGGRRLVVARRVGGSVVLQVVGARALSAADGPLVGASLGRVRGGGPLSIVVR